MLLLLVGTALLLLPTAASPLPAAPPAAAFASRQPAPLPTPTRYGCNSNSTHIGWPSSSSPSSASEEGGSDGGDDGKCTYQTWSDAVSDSVRYLRANLMPFDAPNSGTLGFPPVPESTAERVDGKRPADDNRDVFTTAGSAAAQSGSSGAQSIRRAEQRTLTSGTGAALPAPTSASLPDGLSDGIVNRTVHLALQTKVYHPSWTARIPRPIFQEYVLNFAVANEARTNWRPLLTDAIGPTLERLEAEAAEAEAEAEAEAWEAEGKGTSSRHGGNGGGDDVGNGDERKIRIEDVVEAINRDLWVALGKYCPRTNTTKPIHFVAGQTPLIFDPMSVLGFGYGSCTGLSILLVCALRAAGVPARLAGTPAWYGKEEAGNHNWVEVWTPLENDNDDDDDGSIRPTTNDNGDMLDDDCHGGQWRFLEPAGGDFGRNGDVDNLERDPCSRWFVDRHRFDGVSTRVYAARYDRGRWGVDGAGAGGVVYPLAWDPTNLDVPGEDRTAYYAEVAKRCR